MVRVLTIGVYGSERETFFDALQTAGADAFVDIRRRRAVRGSRYTYANAQRLTAELERRGIAYFHELGLAPDRALLDLQHAADARDRLRYSERTLLAPAYVKGYVHDVLDRFDFAPLVHALDGFRAPVLFCIERIPQACHRSLVAPRLAQALGTAEVIHLIPESRSRAG